MQAIRSVAYLRIEESCGIRREGAESGGARFASNEKEMAESNGDSPQPSRTENSECLDAGTIRNTKGIRTTCVV